MPEEEEDQDPLRGRTPAVRKGEMSPTSGGTVCERDVKEIGVALLLRSKAEERGGDLERRVRVKFRGDFNVILTCFLRLLCFFSSSLL